MLNSRGTQMDSIQLIMRLLMTIRGFTAKSLITYTMLFIFQKSVIFLFGKNFEIYMDESVP